MWLTELVIELIIDILAVGLGILLMLHSQRNYSQFYWGLILVLVGLVFTWENIEWISLIRQDSMYEFREIFSIEKMLKWYFPASVVSLFPIASIRPGYLTRTKVLACLMPTIIVCTMGVSYLCFNGAITPAESVGELFESIGHTDVKLRLFIFFWSVFSPMVYFFYPLLSQSVYRRINYRMYLFVGVLFLMLGIYIFFTLAVNKVIFNIFGISCVVFFSLFAIFYLCYENPFSVRISTDDDPQRVVNEVGLFALANQTEQQRASTEQVHPAFYEIENHLKKQHLFVRPDFRISDLSELLSLKETVISAAVKSCGYTTFKEYLNHVRMEYFKEQAVLNPDRSIKELMYLSGFSSKSTFYRIFKEQHGISPIEFIDKQSV